MEQKWEDRFLNQFEYLLKPIKVTPYYGEDLEKAKILQEAYMNIGEDIKSFIKDVILEREKEIREKLRKGGISSDCVYQDEIDEILSLLAIDEPVEKVNE